MTLNPGSAGKRGSGEPAISGYYLTALAIDREGWVTHAKLYDTNKIWKQPYFVCKCVYIYMYNYIYIYIILCFSVFWRSHYHTLRAIRLYGLRHLFNQFYLSSTHAVQPKALSKWARSTCIEPNLHLGVLWYSHVVITILVVERIKY